MKRLFFSLLLTTIALSSQLEAMWFANIARYAARNAAQRTLSARPVQMPQSLPLARINPAQTSVLMRQFGLREKSLVQHPNFRSDWQQAQHTRNYSSFTQSQKLFENVDQVSSWQPFILGISAGLAAFLYSNSDHAYSSEEVHEQQNFPPSKILQALSENRELTRTQKHTLFKHDCAALKSENHKIPQKNSSTVRIATYNVHFWTDPDGHTNFDAIFDVIKSIDADILILEEVVLGPTKYNNFLSKEQIYKKFEALGYKITADTFGKTTDWGKTAEFGNLILSCQGYETIATKTYQQNYNKKSEKRCYINTKIKLPNNVIVSVYGTHLDVYDETGATRETQIKELVTAINNDTSENIIISGDFNEVQQEDYLYQINGISAWDLIKKENLKRNDPTPTAALDLLAERDFKDCFKKSGQLGPKFTVWSGTVVDYIMLNKTWNLPIEGCYMYYSAASDHMPVIMDVKITGDPKTQN